VRSSQPVNVFHAQADAADDATAIERMCENGVVPSCERTPKLSARAGTSSGLIVSLSAGWHAAALTAVGTGPTNAGPAE